MRLGCVNAWMWGTLKFRIYFRSSALIQSKRYDENSLFSKSSQLSFLSKLKLYIIIIILFCLPLILFTKEKYFRSITIYIYIWRRIGFLYPEFSGRDYSNKKRKRREERLIFHGGGKSFRQTYSYTSNVSYQCRGYSYRILVAVIAACQLEHARFIRKYIYIYTNRESITSSFQETEKEIERIWEGRSAF